MEHKKADEEFGQRVIENFMNVYITPEVKKRQDAGRLPKPLDLRAAQIVFFPDGRETQVRINNEVKAIARVKLKAGISKQRGEPVYEHELEGVDEIRLTEMDDPDCAHATLLRIADRWTLIFDFRYNKALSRKHIETARQFYDTAYYSYQQKNWSPFIDNLFSAAELVARATLLSIPDPRFRKGGTHKSIQIRYNRFADLGNVNAQYREVFNKLSGLRSPARYLKADFTICESEAQELLTVIQRIIEDAEEQIR